MSTSENWGYHVVEGYLDYSPKRSPAEIIMQLKQLGFPEPSEHPENDKHYSIDQLISAGRSNDKDCFLSLPQAEYVTELARYQKRKERPVFNYSRNNAQIPLILALTNEQLRTVLGGGSFTPNPKTPLESLLRTPHAPRQPAATPTENVA